MPDEQISLKEYLEALLAQIEKRYDQRFEDADKAVQAALASAKEAVQAALAAAEKATVLAASGADEWRKSSNEWRGAMSDREKNFVTRVEHDQIVASLTDKIDGLSRSVADIRQVTQ